MCPGMSDADRKLLVYWHLFSIAAGSFFHYLRVATFASITFSFFLLSPTAFGLPFPLRIHCSLLPLTSRPQRSLPLLFPSLFPTLSPYLLPCSTPLRLPCSFLFSLLLPLTPPYTLLALLIILTRPIGALADPTRAAPTAPTPHSIMESPLSTALPESYLLIHAGAMNSFNCWFHCVPICMARSVVEGGASCEFRAVHHRRSGRGLCLALPKDTDTPIRRLVRTGLTSRAVT